MRPVFTSLVSVDYISTPKFEPNLISGISFRYQLAQKPGNSRKSLSGIQDKAQVTGSK
jgi:hypothetical protein